MKSEVMLGSFLATGLVVGFLIATFENYASLREANVESSQAVSDWNAVRRFIVHEPTGEIKSDSSIKQSLGAAYFTTSLRLTFEFQKLSAAQVELVKNNINHVEAFAGDSEKPQTALLIDCFATAKPGDDLSDCGLAVAKASAAGQFFGSR